MYQSCSVLAVLVHIHAMCKVDCNSICVPAYYIYVCVLVYFTLSLAANLFQQNTME